LGHKVHPYGFRLGVSRTWTAKWYADNKEYTASLQEDIKIRALIDKRLANASVSGVEIERGINHVTVTIHTAKPGIVIGKGGANVEILRQQIGALTTRKVKLEIKEIRQPELDAHLVAMNIAQQLSRRIAFKKAMKQSIQRTMKAGAKGVKIAVAGRLGGSEMGRREWDREGRIPLGTLRADISYGQIHAHTTYGRIGVKVWIYRGEAPSTRAEREALQAALRAGGQRRDRDSGRPDSGRPPRRPRRGADGPGNDEATARAAAPVEAAAGAGEGG
jgi:small subunit ribosomal protein S3